MRKTNSFSATGFSVIVHGALLFAMAMIPLDLLDTQPEIEIETIFSDERQQQEFTQELEIDPQVSEELSLIAQGTVSTEPIGPSAATNAAEKISQTKSLQQVKLEVPAAPLSVPMAGAEFIGNLGSGQLKGEGSAFVSGYDAAMSRLTAELLRLMREGPILVVWMFDESESMKDDQKEIRDKFHKIYEELGIAAKKVGDKRRTNGRRSSRNKEVLLTQINSFGEKLNALTPKPTADIREVQAAIDEIKIDKSGKENFFNLLDDVLEKFNPMARRDKRRLVVVVVSDESGDDDGAVEDAIAQAKRADSPIYMMGREAMFGYPYARQEWKDPVYQLRHWIRIRRGPETPYPEALQFDGLHHRWRNYNSGFGPYGQVRLAKETGGIFFVLPGKELALSGRAADKQRKYYALDMKEYEPQLVSRVEYVKKVRDPSRFRREIARVILALNPFQEKKLEIREHWYPVEEEDFDRVAKQEFQKMLFAMQQLKTAVAILEKIKPLRAEEPSQRWRASFDLIYAQCLSYRVRLFQSQLSLDNYLQKYPDTKGFNFPPPRGEEKKGQVVDHWNLERRQKMIEPTERQVKLTKIDMDLLKQHDKLARELYKNVVQEHPKTPWAHVAGEELRYGFGVAFVKRSRSAYYGSAKIKIPNF